MGGEKQVTMMVLKVDLQCCKCYKKVKKILCKIPQVQDQIYDEKNDTVIIKVVCCSAEKIKEKIICKGGDFIKSIEIKVPEVEKSKPADKPKELPPPPSPPADKPKELPPTPPSPKPPCQKPPPPPQPVLVPIGVCCQQCYIGYPGGPCFHPHGWPSPCYQHHWHCGRPVCDSCGCGCGCGRNCYTSNCGRPVCDICGCGCGCGRGCGCGCGRNCYTSNCDTQGCTTM